jgi:glycosyltransferase involved in cell wall biosynthesis
MRLLFLKRRLLWPRATGHDVHGYHLMKAFQERGHSLGLLTVEAPTPEAISGLDLEYQSLFPTEWQGPPTEPPPYLLRRFMSYYGVESHHLAGVRQATARYQPQVVIAEGGDLVPCLSAVQGPLRVWHAADEYGSQHLNQIRCWNWRTWHHLRKAAILMGYERVCAPYCDRVWVVSETDQRWMRRVMGHARVQILPNGVDAEHFQPSSEDERPFTAVFWGRLDNAFNLDAITWFVEKVWRGLKARTPQARFEVFGFGDDPRLASLSQEPGVTIERNLPDLRARVRNAAVAVLPFQGGGGVKNKLLEAAALGLAIVASPLGCNGLKGTPPVVVASTPGEWQSRLTELWTDQARLQRVRQATREWVVAEHSWDRTAQLALADLQAGSSI